MNSQSCFLFDLRFDLPSISTVRECHLKVLVIPTDLTEQRKGSIAVLDGSACHLDSKKQSQGIYNKVAFAPFDFLSSVKPAGFHAFLGAFRALAIQDADARRSCPWGTIGMGCSLPHLVTQGIVHFLDDAVVAPLSVVFEHLFPRRKIMWQIPPLASCPFAVEDRIHDVTALVLWLPQIGKPYGFRNMRTKNFPLRIRQVGRVSGRHEPIPIRPEENANFCAVLL